MYDLIFKVVIFGDAGSGKTSLRRRFLTNEFLSDSQKTIGVDFETAVIELEGKEMILPVSKDFASCFLNTYMGLWGGFYCMI